MKAHNKETKEKVTAGSVPTEISAIVRKCITKGNTVKAKISSEIPVDNGKGQEITCVYMFSGNENPDMKNHAKEIEKGTFLFYCKPMQE